MLHMRFSFLCLPFMQMTDDAFAWVLRIMDEYMEFKKQSAVAVLQTACEAYFKIPLYVVLCVIGKRCERRD